MAIKINKTKKNIIYTTSYNILTIIIPLILSPYLSRALGAQALGTYSFTLAVANYFKRFSLLGMEKYANRSIALAKNNSIEKRQSFWGAYKIQLACSIVCLIAYGIYIKAWGGEGLSATLQFIFVLSSAFDVSWYYFGSERFKPVIITSSIFKLLYLVLTIVLIKDSSDLNLYIILAALSYLVPNVITFIIALTKEKYIKSNKKELKQILKGTLLLFIPVVAVTLYKSMDKVMLGFICNTSIDNGLYENAEKILHVPIAIISAISIVMLPKMTKMYKDKKNKQAEEYINKTMDYSAIICTLITFGLIGASYLFSIVFWGDEFQECGELLKLFAISIPFMGFAEVIRTQYIIPKKLDRVYVRAVCLGAIVNFIVNIFLIPKAGAKGAVIGTVFAEAAVCIYQAYSIRQKINLTNLIKSYVKTIPAGAIMGILLIIISEKMQHNVINLLLVTIVGVVLFTIFEALTIIIIDKDKRDTVKKIIMPNHKEK